MISAIFRFFSIFPLVMIFVTIFKTFWEKINTINGLRRTRISLMLLMLALLIDNIYFFLMAVINLFDGVNSIATDPVILFFDKLLMAISFYTLYFLFKHASHNSLSEGHSKHP